MKKMSRWLSRCGIALSLVGLAVSCQKNELPEPPKSQLNLEYNVIEATWEAGRYEIGYTIDNPREDETLVFGQTPEWITVSAETEGTIAVDVAENETKEPRQGEFAVSYAEQSVTVTVNQGVDPGPFKIEVVETGQGHVVINVTPDDPEMPYLCVTEIYEDYQKYDSDESFLQGYVSYLERRASRYHVSLYSYVLGKKMLQQGAIENYRLSYLVPGQTYLIGCAGFDLSKKQFVTQLSQVKVETAPVDLVDATFDVKVEITGPVIDLDVTPSDETLFYQVGLIETAEEPDAEEVIKSSQKSFFELLEYLVDNNIPLEEAIDAVTYAGRDTLDWEVKEETSYCGVVFGVDKENGFIVTEPAMKMVMTESVTPSDNIITLAVKEARWYSADLSVRTTNRDPYVLGTIPIAELEGMTDEEILEELTSGKYSLPPSKRGDIDITTLGLKPETDYYLLAWGYSAGKVTTGLTKTTFTTIAVPESCPEPVAVRDSVMKDEWTAKLDQLFTDWISFPRETGCGSLDLLVPMKPAAEEVTSFELK